jgi:hypothetical protein
MWHAGGRVEVFTGFWLGCPKVRDHWKEVGVGGKLDSAGSGWGPVASFCEHGNEPSGSIRKQDFFDKLCDNQLFQ